MFEVKFFEKLIVKCAFPVRVFESILIFHEVQKILSESHCKFVGIKESIRSTVAQFKVDEEPFQRYKRILSKHPPVID